MDAPHAAAAMSAWLEESTRPYSSSGLKAVALRLWRESGYCLVFFFFKQKTAYEIGLGIPAEPLFRSYDVDGTDQTSLGQFSGRVQQTYKHSVPRFFVPEHGTMFTLALVRFPPTATKEIQYLNAKGALTYTDIAGDPVLYG